jgi:hypothetical protein
MSMRNISRLLTASLLVTACAASAQEYRQAMMQAAEQSAAEYNQRMADYAQKAAEGYRDKCLNYADASYCDKLIEQSGAASAGPAVVGQPAPQSPSQLVQYAASANQKIADGAAKMSALPQTQATLVDVNAATQKIARIEARLQEISGRINGPRPSTSGFADELMSLMAEAGSAADQAVPDGHGLAETYDPLLARVAESAPYGDAVMADKAMEVSAANMQRALVETRREAYRIGQTLMTMGDRELGYYNLRAFSYDANMSRYQSDWGRVKAGVAKPEAGSPQAYADYLKQLDDMSVYSWQASN